MRSLEACKAEIFRRSEEKIKQRKKMRNRVLAACVPVCLCVVIGAAGVFSGAFGAKSGNMVAAPESAGWNNNGFGMMDADMKSEESCESNGSPLYCDPSSTTATDASVDNESPLGGTTSELVITAESCADYESLKEVLLNLDYLPHKVCRCLPQYKLKTDFGEFGIHLSEGYARCEDGQAKLTAEQVKTLRQIIKQLMNQ